METIQKICGLNGYNYKSNHSETYRDINHSINLGVKIILLKRGVINTHLGKPYNITIKYGTQTLRDFQPMRRMLDSKELGNILKKNISKLISNE